MTREKLMALLRDPNQTGQSVNELNRLIGEYSYFHTGHQLYLQGLKKSGETQLAHQLGKSAINVRDRGILYNYINRPSLFRQQTEASQEDLGDVMTSFAPGNAFVLPEADIHQIQQIETSVAEQSGVPLPTLGQEGFRREPEEPVFAEERIMSDTELLAIIQRQLEQIKDPAPESDNKVPAAHGGTDRTITNLPEELSTVDPEEKPQSVCPAGPPASGQTSLADLILNQLKKAEEAVNTEVAASERNTKKTPDNLIDAFLQSNPKIVPATTDYQVDLTESLQEDQDIATETLADIYLSQGHKQKAIEIYRHLILKYPEKHIYFAAQIDRLK